MLFVVPQPECKQDENTEENNGETEDKPEEKEKEEVKIKSVIVEDTPDNMSGYFVDTPNLGGRAFTGTKETFSKYPRLKSRV